MQPCDFLLERLPGSGSCLFGVCSTDSARSSIRFKGYVSPLAHPVWWLLALISWPGRFCRALQLMPGPQLNLQCEPDRCCALKAPPRPSAGQMLSRSRDTASLAQGCCSSSHLQGRRMCQFHIVAGLCYAFSIWQAVLDKVQHLPGCLLG